MIALMRNENMQYSPSPNNFAGQPQPQGGGGPSPAMAMQFMPQSGGAAAGGSGSGGSMMAAAGPWAALAAVIAANETYQNKSGNRPKDAKDQLKEGLTGESLERDVTRYLGDGEAGQFIGRMGHPKGVVKNMGKVLKPWEWF